MLGIAMEDTMFKQGWKWLLFQKHMVLGTQVSFCYFRDKSAFLVDHHWPVVSNAFVRFGKFLLLLLVMWKDCIVRGLRSIFHPGAIALFVILWSFFLSLTSITCVIYVLLILGAGGAVVRYLGYTPGFFIAGLFGILLMWMYGNFWITGMLLIAGGYFFFLNRARLVILMSTIYAIYCVNCRVGWVGVFLSVNLGFLSNDLFSYLLYLYDGANEVSQVEKDNESEPILEDFSEKFEYFSSASDSDDIFSCNSSVRPCAMNFVNASKSATSKIVHTNSSSVNEMKRIINSLDHYEALGIPRNKIIDASVLRKEYRKKAMLVHPDKNMGSPLASESFKKLQCAYEVLSDSTKKRNYDEKLRKEESLSVCQKSRAASHPDGMDLRSEESRRIQCTKCPNWHVWICTKRNKSMARWCQDCCLYHPARDGDGWVEKMPQEVEIPRAFVCAESKIFDVSEWAICQGMTCKPNTHVPSFRVNMVGMERSSQRFKDVNSRYHWNLDAEKMKNEDDAFELWLQQAWSSGIFPETTTRRCEMWQKLAVKVKCRKWISSFRSH